MQVQTESELSLEDIKDREAKIRQLEVSNSEAKSWSTPELLPE